MNDNKSRDIFYGVVAVATLIVAIVGATLAYFSISAGSNEGAVSAKAAVVSVNYTDGIDVIAQAKKLIPSRFDIMQFFYEKNKEDLTNATPSSAAASLLSNPPSETASAVIAFATVSLSAFTSEASAPTCPKRGSAIFTDSNISA